MTWLSAISREKFLTNRLFVGDDVFHMQKALASIKIN